MKYDLQKASLTKRISAFLFDGIMVGMLIVGLALLLSALLGFDSYNRTLSDRYEKYEKEFGITLNLTQEEFEKLSEEELALYEQANKAISQDQDAIYAYNMIISLSLVIATLAVLGAFLIWEFAIPQWLGNGQTLGKKIFSIAVMRNDGVKLNAVSLFVRTVLGKFTIETMIPVMLVLLTLFGGLGLLGTVLLGLILLMQVVLMITSRTNALIHDKLANTVVVDMASQMIFGSELEMIAYKEKMHAERAARKDY